jgi:hypothetical protein
VPPVELTVKLTVTVAPVSEGSGLSPVIDVVVAAGGGASTACAAVPELPLKAAVPGYVAVRVRFPSVVSARVQLPCPPLSASLQLSTPSLTVTVPVGVRAAEPTVKLTVTVAPVSEGSGLSAVIDVVVAEGGGASTLCEAVPELPLKAVLPE